MSFLISLNLVRVFYLHYSGGADMRLWEGKERKTHYRHLKTIEILIKAVNVPLLQLGTAFFRGSYVREELQDCSASSFIL